MAKSKQVKKVKESKEVKAQSQGITDFAKEFVKTKGTGLTLQGKAQRRIKGLVKALTARKWSVDSKDSLIFTRAFKNRKFTVTIDKTGQTAVINTLGKVVQFPLGKGAFKSVDYVLNAYGHRYSSGKQVYEEIESAV